MRFAMRIDRWMRPLALLFSGTAARSFIEVTDASVRFRFGFFEEIVPRSEIASAEPYRPRWYQGLGWRWLPNHIMLFGSHRGVVSLRLAHSRRVRLIPLLPRLWPAQQVSMSVQDPEGLLAALNSR